MSPIKINPTLEEKNKDSNQTKGLIISKKDNLLSLKMESSIMENGWEMYVGAMEYKSGLMVPSIRDNGKMERLME